MSETPIPAVCFIEDVCRLLRVSRSTVKRLRRHRAFPIAEMGSLDKRPRWSGEKVKAFIEGENELAWRRRRTG